MTPSTAERIEPLAAGDRVLDRYIIERKIATGGHSVVYRGIDERLSRPVCVKAFHKLSSEPGIWKTAYEHFVQEAFALSKLSHPNTLRIYDFGQIEKYQARKFPIQVSEFMAGGTLAQLVAQGGPLGLIQTVDAIGKLAEALAEAHQLSIVHRDIKPQNILFTVPGPSREPKLADFGIAKSVTSDNVSNQAEQTEVVAGFPLAMFSPSWGAPEQLCGEPATPSIDVYSLGIVAVYALSGQAILKSKTTQDGYERRRHANALIGEVLAQYCIPPKAIQVLQSACAFREQDRPNGARAFADALRDSLHAAPRRLNSAPHLNQQAEQAQGTVRNKVPETTTRGEPQQQPRQGQRQRAQRTSQQQPLQQRAQRTSQQPPALPTTNAENPIIVNRTATPQRIGSRTCQFLEFVSDAALLQLGATRLKVMSTPSPTSRFGRTLTVRGVTSFISKIDGRPSSAAHLDQDEYLDLVDPRKKALGRIHVSFGRHEAQFVYFRVGDLSVALPASECTMPICIDSPAHQLSFFLYAP